jgi:hypothetical protein
MKINPIEEWRRLTEHYREMSDEELLGLAAGMCDLTEQAQQVLRDEMKLRKLDRPQAAQAEIAARRAPEARRWSLAEEAPQPVPDAEKSDSEEEDTVEPHEFTWKTVLCERHQTEEAWQLREALRRAGIDSWVEDPGTPLGHSLNYPRVLVAADQLEQARQIAEQPIPQEIIDEFNAPEEEYQPPVCPKCGAEDPVLESADPVNSWLCESCGAQWSDPADAQPEIFQQR